MSSREPVPVSRPMAAVPAWETDPQWRCVTCRRQTQTLIRCPSSKCNYAGRCEDCNNGHLCGLAGRIQ